MKALGPFPSSHSLFWTVFALLLVSSSAFAACPEVVHEARALPPGNCKSDEALRDLDEILIGGLEAGDRFIDKNGIAFRWVPPGRYRVGSPCNEPGQIAREGLHDINLNSGLWIAETELTHSQLFALGFENPSAFQKCGPDCPVENLTYYEAAEIANKLSRDRELSECFELSRCNGVFGAGLTCGEVKLISCNGYGLPTEWEWEVAARAGLEINRYPGPLTLDQEGRAAPELAAIAWYNLDEEHGPKPVAGKEPNSWCFFDMLGNVEEWTVSEANIDPRNPRVLERARAMGYYLGREIRGGMWAYPARAVRVQLRTTVGPDVRTNAIGMRLVIRQPGPPPETRQLLDAVEPGPSRSH